MTRRMTLPAPAQPSSATTGSATSQTEGSPIACASLASVAVTASKVSLLSLWDRGKEAGVKEHLIFPRGKRWIVRRKTVRGLE